MSKPLARLSSAPEKCECDNTHEKNHTVCRVCHAAGFTYETAWWREPSDAQDEYGGWMTVDRLETRLSAMLPESTIIDVAAIAQFAHGGRISQEGIDSARQHFCDRKDEMEQLIHALGAVGDSLSE